MPSFPAHTTHTAFDHTAAIRGRIVRVFRFLPRHLFAVVMCFVYGGGLSTFRNPKTFSQLLAAKNLRNRDERLTITTDKYAVRAYVAQRVREEYLVPMRQYVTSADDLDPALLTPPCVVKATHGCDMTVLLRDGDSLDIDAVKAVAAKWLKTDFSREWKERSYEGVTPGVIVEEFLGDGKSAPYDYKFYVFAGRVELMQINMDRFVYHRVAFVDRNWRPLNVHGFYQRPMSMPERPDTLDEMIEIAEKLGNEFDFVRVDLYSVDGRVYFGEITHYPGGGKLFLKPKSFDKALGKLWLEGTPIPDEFLATP